METKQNSFVPLHIEQATHDHVMGQDNGSFALCTEQRQEVARISGYCIGYRNAQELGEFIVRACNTHDKLVTALQSIGSESIFRDDEGAMDLGERLLRIEALATAAMREMEENHEHAK